MIGFQGSDPYTDLRASGILFIDNFIYFIKNYPEQSKECLEIANKEDNFFFFAVVGIHATMWCIDILNTESFIKFMINECYKYEPIIIYQELFAWTLVQFTYKWDEKQRDIMEFNIITREFVKSIKTNSDDAKQFILNQLALRKKKL